MAEQGHNISIDEARAKIWILDVQEEIRATEMILEKVANVNSENVTDDDVVFGAIREIGKKMHTVWADLCKNFKTANSIINEVIENIARGGTSIVSDFQDFKSRFH